jgi:hypothetical protein
MVDNSESIARGTETVAKDGLSANTSTHNN